MKNMRNINFEKLLREKHLGYAFIPLLNYS